MDILSPTQATTSSNRLQAIVGSLNGINQSFALRFQGILIVPQVGILEAMVFRNGLLQLEGEDYLWRPQKLKFIHVPETVPTDIVTIRAFFKGGPTRMSPSFGVTGAANGVNPTFLMPPRIITAMVFLNGLYATPGLDYTFIGRFVNFTIPPLLNEQVTFLLFTGGRDVSTFDGSIAGDIDGVNQTFTLPDASIFDALVFWNGLLLTSGTDYTLAFGVISLTVAPQGDDVITARIYGSSGPIAAPTWEGTTSTWETTTFTWGFIPEGSDDGGERAPIQYTSVDGGLSSLIPFQRLQLYRNGLLMTRGYDYHNTTEGFDISPPASDDRLSVQIWQDGSVSPVTGLD